MYGMNIKIEVQSVFNIRSVNKLKNYKHDVLVKGVKI